MDVIAIEKIDLCPWFDLDFHQWSEKLSKIIRKCKSMFISAIDFSLPEVVLVQMKSEASIHVGIA